MTAREQAAVIHAAILATFRQAFPQLDVASLIQAAHAAANNAAMALTVDEDE